MEQARSFEGVDMDQNQMQKPGNVATRSQKPAVDSKAKAKVNSKPAKTSKENSECHLPALPAKDAKEVPKDVALQSKSIKKARATKISSK